MKSFRNIFLFFLLLGTINTFAAKVDTILTYSPSMNKNIKACVVTPDNYKTDKNFPVIYYLHGYSGSFSSWQSTPDLTKLADLYNLILVFPDGNYSSWYFDSPIDANWKYETYISKELIDFMDKNYKTIASREGRAITGLSMGGHGAFFIAFRHQDVFGACGSMSGGVDIRPFPLNWDIAKRLGDMKTHSENWEKYTVINQLHYLTPNSIKIIFDCGTDDFFYNVNVKLHEELMYRNIPHDFISRPGGHDKEYWDNSIQYQALFFSTYFKSMNKK
ncbi:putative esterase [uncultured Paludibacter sp.]|nr:putative esterase [uncultured Paludibacter sp.]